MADDETPKRAKTEDKETPPAQDPFATAVLPPSPVADDLPDRPAPKPGEGTVSTADEPILDRPHHVAEAEAGAGGTEEADAPELRNAHPRVRELVHHFGYTLAAALEHHEREQRAKD